MITANDVKYTKDSENILNVFFLHKKCYDGQELVDNEKYIPNPLNSKFFSSSENYSMIR